MHLRTADDRVSVRSLFKRAKKLEHGYRVQLRRLARHIGDIAHAHDAETSRGAERIRQGLLAYAQRIDPWADSVANRVIAEIAAADRESWRRSSDMVGRLLHKEIASAPTGDVIRESLDRQVWLIKSLPIEAAERVHRLTTEGMSKGRRTSEIAKDILASGDVARSRADLIARTEVARTATELTKARAEHIGSTHFIWRCVHDAATRPSHRKLDGQTFRWDAPPECDRGYHALPGGIWNCFPGSTKVSLTNGCHKLWRHWYEGRLVVIQHEMGFLELTPNHPILTGRGWVAAEDIEAGDDIVQSVQDHLFALDDDKDQGQPTFAEVFAALETVLDREAHSGLLFDFHGYVPDQDVDAISADHLLPGHRVSEGFQRICDLALAGSDRSVEDRRIAGREAEISEANRASGRDQGSASLGAHRLHSPDVGLAAGALLHSVPRQNTTDDQAGALQAKGNREFALAERVGLDDLSLVKVCASVQARGNAVGNFDTASADILADQVRVDPDFLGSSFDRRPSSYKRLRVINKTDRRFAGHVFTMATVNGWFTVSDAAIVSKNCRCFPEPVIASAE